LAFDFRLLNWLPQELAGFFVYSHQILAWLPPLIFTGLVEADVSQTYAVISVSGFFLIALGILRFASPWDVILRESGRLDEEGLLTGEQDEHVKDLPTGEEEGQDEHNHVDQQPQHGQEQLSKEY
jgi:hypothetical protein